MSLFPAEEDLMAIDDRCVEAGKSPASGLTGGVSQAFLTICVSSCQTRRSLNQVGEAPGIKKLFCFFAPSEPFFHLNSSKLQMSSEKVRKPRNRVFLLLLISFITCG